MGRLRKVRIWDWPKVTMKCFELFISKKQIAQVSGIPYRTVTGTMGGFSEGEGTVLSIMDAINKICRGRGEVEPFDYDNLTGWMLPASVQKKQAEANLARIKASPYYGMAKKYDRTNTFEMKKREDKLRLKFDARLLKRMEVPIGAEASGASGAAPNSRGVVEGGGREDGGYPASADAGGTQDVDGTETVRKPVPRSEGDMGGTD